MHLLPVVGLGLVVEGLAGLGLATDGLESLDAELLAGLGNSVVPGGDLLVRLLALGGLLLGHDLIHIEMPTPLRDVCVSHVSRGDPWGISKCTVLVLDQVGLLAATDGLGLGVLPHLPLLADLGDLLGLHLAHLHGLHGLHSLHLHRHFGGFGCCLVPTQVGSIKN